MGIEADSIISNFKEDSICNYTANKTYLLGIGVFLNIHQSFFGNTVDLIALIEPI